MKAWHIESTSQSALYKYSRSNLRKDTPSEMKIQQSKYFCNFSRQKPGRKFPKGFFLMKILMKTSASLFSANFSVLLIYSCANLLWKISNLAPISLSLWKRFLSLTKNLRRNWDSNWGCMSKKSTVIVAWNTYVLFKSVIDYFIRKPTVLKMYNYFSLFQKIHLQELKSFMTLISIIFKYGFLKY